ncbi:hypothetical protein G7072_08520 [Nocardioides sp. HDW12B]|uniref:hypothetical protein n=1 Tax=Nocardioides sp. HDW12B TaxID=2714939 RepID=UPI00140AB38B|nr:hypothetical protein [Nocardioides sp. HDW12B]QIK66397.1 hypothetical protein G7072_08520 [Nocardioides sp. HDW12B]
MATTRPAPPARRGGAAFLLPLLAVLWASETGAEGRTTGRELFTVAVVCVAAGAAWNLLHRRDLADRLTHLAACFSVVVVIHLGYAWDSAVSSSAGTGWGLLGVVTGLVWAEQWSRHRDSRRRARAARASRARTESLTAVSRRSLQD